MNVNVGGGVVVGVAQNLLQDFRLHAALAGAGGVGVPGGVGGAAGYAQPVQQGVVIPAAEVVQQVLASVAGKEQRTGGLCGKIGKVLPPLRADGNDPVAACLGLLAADEIGLVPVGKGQRKQLANAHTRVDEHEDNPGRFAAVLAQLVNVGLGENLLFFFHVLGQADKRRQIGGDDLLPHGPFRHLGQQLLELGDHGVGLVKMLVHHSLKVCCAQGAEFLAVEAPEQVKGVVVGLVGGLRNLPVMLGFPGGKHLGKGHVVGLLDRAPGQAVQGLKGGGPGLEIADDDLVFGSHPGTFAAALQLVDRACAVGPLHRAAGPWGLLGPAGQAEFTFFR